MIEKHFEIITTTGFARPASLMVSVAGKFESNIFLEFLERKVHLENSPLSIMDVMSLGIIPGEYFSISADGSDEIKALEILESSLIKENLVKKDKSDRD